jgi:hypothetical protein
MTLSVVGFKHGDTFMYILFAPIVVLSLLSGYIFGAGRVFPTYRVELRTLAELLFFAISIAVLMLCYSTLSSFTFDNLIGTLLLTFYSLVTISVCFVAGYLYQSDQDDVV